MRVDLNPIRAAIAKDLKGSDFTSIKERIENNHTWLSGFGMDDNDLPFYLSSYISLVDETGRCIRGDTCMDVSVSREQDAEATKCGFISEKSAKTIDEVSINPDDWLHELKGFKSTGFSAVDTAEQLKEFSKKTKRKWTHGIKLKPALE